MPFRPAHLVGLDAGRHERAILGAFAPAAFRALWPAGPGLTAVSGGRVIGCAGVMIEGGEGTVWSVLSDEIRARPFFLHRTALAALGAMSAHLPRLRLTVDSDFAAGRRWASALGFRYRRELPWRGPNGETFAEYVR